jgi:hypothetical protein
MKHHWNPEVAGEIAEMIGELGKLGKLMGSRSRHTNPEKIRRIREAVSRACKEIEAILEE